MYIHDLTRLGQFSFAVGFFLGVCSSCLRQKPVAGCTLPPEVTLGWPRAGTLKPGCEQVTGSGSTLPRPSLPHYQGLGAQNADPLAFRSAVKLVSTCLNLFHHVSCSTFLCFNWQSKGIKRQWHITWRPWITAGNILSSPKSLPSFDPGVGPIRGLKFNSPGRR